VVSDTSPIRVLSHLSHLHLLDEFFDEVLIPPAVARELETPESHNAAVSLGQIRKCRVQAPNNASAIRQLEAELQTGEAEAIVLARELGAELLIDERAGRLVAERLGIIHLGVIGLLVRAKQKGIIGNVVPLVLQTRDEMNFFVSDTVIEQVRRLTGE
jgi:predicted nucleic acid-binding protein